MAINNKMESKAISTYIFKLIGSISLIHAFIGIVLILFSIITQVNIETADFTQALNDQNINKSIDLSEEETSEVLSQLPEITSSNDFNFFYWSMTTFGFITNILLIYFGYYLIKAKYKFALAYIALMGITYVYMHQAPALLTDQTNYALSFGAAWGIGNMGVSLLLVTHFWLWGPALAIIGIFTQYISHNKAVKRDK